LKTHPVKPFEVTSAKPIYILGTGLSHNGSTCLLKDGKIIVAIEKERLSRIKHDGGNDTLSVQYCLDYAGITVNDLALVVQVANFEKDIRKSAYRGKRVFSEDCTVPFVTISHHLAHAYSAVGTSPFNECNVLVIDGCGSPYNQCEDLDHAFIPGDIDSQKKLYGEKDSYYFFDGQCLHSVYKDFSTIELGAREQAAALPTSRHSIGGFYSMVSGYCFGNMDDAGKLMGLAPFGEKEAYNDIPIFHLENGRVHVIEEVLQYFSKPMDPILRPFNDHFQYYANIARWVQREVEKAVVYVVQSRLVFQPNDNLCYAGGVALNAVANSKIIKTTGLKNFYMEPAAGDNGLALGCAFYGWIEVMKKQKVAHNGSTLFGKPYSNDEIAKAIENYEKNNSGKEVKYSQDEDYIATTATYLNDEKIIGWFQYGAEFGPRALGRRSILADPRKRDVKQIINREVKFREDFRPFAPAVLAEDAHIYFEHGHESPYMILVDNIRPYWHDALNGIVHEDGTCRVQTVVESWNKPFHQLITSFKQKSGLSVLLNTSFNKKGMPMVETPAEALDFFYNCNLDVLVMNNYIIVKE